MSMANNDGVLQLTGIIVEDEGELTLVQICRACSAHAEHIIELVEEGVLAPTGPEPRRWRFSGSQMRRATVALRLQRDLGVNLSGVALVLELLEELESLRARVRALDR
jgi:chaperone modulatory protein CbpM